MAKNPYAKRIRRLLKMLRSADRHVLRGKKQLVKVLGPDANDSAPVKLVDCAFDVDGHSYDEKLSAGQGDAIKEIVAKGGGVKDVVEKLHELLKRVDCAAVEAQKSLAEALLAASRPSPSSSACPPDLGCCTYSVNGDMAKAQCISKEQCDQLGGTWQLGPG
jgi:hypothetical protein